MNLVYKMTLKDLQKKLHEECMRTETSEKGMRCLINYYRNHLGWTTKQATIYALGLFHNGTIQKIKHLNQDGIKL